MRELPDERIGEREKGTRKLGRVTGLWMQEEEYISAPGAACLPCDLTMGNLSYLEEELSFGFSFVTWVL